MRKLSLISFLIILFLGSSSFADGLFPMKPGTSYTTYGNTTFGSDGTSYTTYGNTTFGSDGSSSTTYGNTTFGSGGSSCTTYGSTTFCN